VDGNGFVGQIWTGCGMYWIWSVEIQQKLQQLRPIGKKCC